MLNTRKDLEANVKSDSVLHTSGKCDLKKQHSVTQATQTSPEVPWPSQSASLPEPQAPFLQGCLTLSQSSGGLSAARPQTTVPQGLAWELTRLALDGPHHQAHAVHQPGSFVRKLPQKCDKRHYVLCGTNNEELSCLPKDPCSGCQEFFLKT